MNSEKSIVFISRKEAQMRLGYSDDIAQIIRNYEIEQRLLSQHTKFIINEWCPFNWIYCSWADYETIECLEALARHIRETKPYENSEHCAKQVDQLIDKRKNLLNKKEEK